MRPSNIAQIIIRLFAISLCMQGVMQTVRIFSANDHGMPNPAFLVSGAVAILLSLGAWFFAPAIGRIIISRGMDLEGSSSGITFQQLLNVMFIGVGLFYSLGSLGVLINGLHFLLVVRASPQAIPQGMFLSPYELSKNAITFVAGIILIAAAPYWSRKISNKE